MGCFDSVFIRCPKCGNKIEYQSKACQCDMGQYKENAVPLAIAADIEYTVRQCSNCGAKVAASQLLSLQTVPMHGELLDGDSEAPNGTCDNCRLWQEFGTYHGEQTHENLLRACRQKQCPKVTTRW
ncbi:MAG: hypothetical protein NC218_01765 [Acetobacter sp.]|nr:hypothetical protein [Acetobacter sp.]